LVLPAISPRLRSSPRVQIELFVRETSDLSLMLDRSVAGFVLLDRGA
jgi:hypothetical protein